MVECYGGSNIDIQAIRRAKLRDVDKVITETDLLRREPGRFVTNHECRAAVEWVRVHSKSTTGNLNATDCAFFSAQVTTGITQGVKVSPLCNTRSTTSAKGAISTPPDDDYLGNAQCIC